MNIWDESFQKIKDKTKTIEMRLCDEKRSVISVGDIIEFTNTKNGEILKCIVTNLFKYKNFDELYKCHNKISIGYSKDEIASPADMLAYYSIEKIEKYGVLGIEIRICEIESCILSNIDKLHTTEKGIDRIYRNLRLDNDDVIEYCKKKILDKKCNVYKQGKNWYCEIDNIKITINAYSYTIITAHLIK